MKTLGTLLQSVAVLLVADYSVVRRRRSKTVRVCGVNNVTLTFVIDNTLLEVIRGHLLMGSSAGVALRRKNIIGALRSAHPGQNSGVECKSKSWPDRNLQSEGSCQEIVV